MRQAVVCIASDVKHAERLVQSLKNAGFVSEDVSVLMPDSYGAQELGYQKHSKAPEGIAIGAVTGAILGGALGYLAGIGAVWIPGTEMFITAGPLVAALNGIAAVGAVSGFVGGLIGLAIPEYEVKKYERQARFGSTLIAVHADTEKEAKSAEETLRNAGGSCIHRTIEDSVRLKSA